MKQLLLAAMVIALGACAASGTDTSASDAAMAAAESTAETTASTTPDDGVVCRWEKRPGSNFREKICRTVAEIEARAEQDQGALRQMRAIRSGSQADMGN